MKAGFRCAAMLLCLVSPILAKESKKEAPPTLTGRTSGLKRSEGFIPTWWDAKKGVLLLELPPRLLQKQLLYYTGFGTGIGSIRLFADRSSLTGGALIRLQRSGPRLLVIQENPAFRAEAGSDALKQSVEKSFPVSVLAALPIEAEESGTLLVDANPLILRDAADLLSQLRSPVQAVNGRMVRQESSQGSWRLDESRSVVDPENSGSYPMNTEIEALLTFASEGGTDLNQPESRTLSLRQHHSFVALPPPGFEPRESDPRVGFIPVPFQDFSQPFDRPLERSFIERWRLIKKDPRATVSDR